MSGSKPWSNLWNAVKHDIVTWPTHSTNTCSCLIVCPKKKQKHQRSRDFSGSPSTKLERCPEVGGSHFDSPDRINHLFFLSTFLYLHASSFAFASFPPFFPSSLPFFCFLLFFLAFLFPCFLACFRSSSLLPEQAVAHQWLCFCRSIQSTRESCK